MKRYKNIKDNGLRELASHALACLKQRVLAAEQWRDTAELPTIDKVTPLGVEGSGILMLKLSLPDGVCSLPFIVGSHLVLVHPDSMSPVVSAQVVQVMPLDSSIVIGYVTLFQGYAVKDIGSPSRHVTPDLLVLQIP